MSSDFKIYIDRLTSGKEVQIEEEVSSDFLELNEDELIFPKPVSIVGNSYIAEDYLVIHLKVKTTFEMPCLVCNEMKEHELKMEPFYITKKLEEIKNSIFDFSSSLRESILLNIPPFIECSDGNCPNRDGLKSYMQKKLSNNPFKDIK